MRKRFRLRDTWVRDGPYRALGRVAPSKEPQFHRLPWQVLFQLQGTIRYRVPDGQPRFSPRSGSRLSFVLFLGPDPVTGEER